jgi:AraC-like DNA-binding protein
MNMELSVFDSLYTVTLLILAAALLGPGLLLLFLRASDSPKLGAYRNASRVMGFTFLFFSAVNVFEFWERVASGNQDNRLLFTLVTLVIASVQAFMFTFAMVSLINTVHYKRKAIMRETALIGVFAVVGIAGYIFVNDTVTTVFAYLYTAFYFSQLARYTLLFIRLYRQSKRELENYFSGQEAERLRWIFFSFFSALFIGLMALSFALFPAPLFGVVCSIACLLFYVFFAIRFVNYSIVFNRIEEVISDEQQPTEYDDVGLPTGTQKRIEHKLARWIEEKQYRNKNITISDVAQEIGINKKYLSIYLNKVEHSAFCNWVNTLRINDAKQLLTDSPELPVLDVALITGFSTGSHFGQQFRNIIGVTPSDFRKQLIENDVVAH